MSISPGASFGSFRIGESLGAGGMGEVYRATDTSLKREVAIKFLPAAFVADPDRLARFQREAEMLAALNHPNIAQVYGLEQADGVTAIVMELVDGPTLAERIEAGPIAPDEAMAIAFQVIDALEAAHDKHIVHRDLKPANVKVRADGSVKVLDFGISKPIDPTAISGRTPVMTTPAVTETGVIVGTAAYMSPEQARGRFVDERTDIWAFGCLLFEMLSGEPAFGGEDVMLTLARVLDRPTDLSSIPKSITPAVRHAIELCLEKDAKKRISDIRDVRLALQGRFDTSPEQHADSPRAVPLLRRAVLPVAALLAGAALAALVALSLRTEPEPGLVSRFAHILPREQRLVPGIVIRYFDLSPDGRRFVYITTDGVYKREMDELEARLIRGTEDETVAFVSFGSTSDEIFVIMNSEIGIERLSVEGGAISTFMAPNADADSTPDLGSIIWTPSGDLIIGHRGGISLRRRDNLAVAERVIDLDDNEQASGARLLPDGDTVLFALKDVDDELESARIVAQSITTGERADVLPRGHYPRYVNSGHLLYVLDGVIHAVAFDADSLRTTGESIVVLTDVRLGATEIPQYAIADNGTLAYMQRNAVAAASEDAPQIQLTWLYPGPGARLEGLIEGARSFNAVAAPDGRSLAYSEVLVDTGDIYTYDLRLGLTTRLTRGEFNDRRPFWTRDSRYVIYDRSDAGGGLFRIPANGGEPERLETRPETYLVSVPYWISEDGDTLIFERAGPDSGAGIFTLAMASGEVTPLIDDPDFRESGAAVSPDQRYIAYSSDESGAPQIYISPYPDTNAGRRIVTGNGGTEPFWNSDGNLYFLDATMTLMRIAVQTDPELDFGQPQAVFPVPVLGGSFTRPNFGYDPVGRRFLIRQNTSLAAGTDSDNVIIIVENWTEWLKREVLGDEVRAR